jgi:hypothetical protein
MNIINNDISIRRKLMRIANSDNTGLLNSIPMQNTISEPQLKSVTNYNKDVQIINSNLNNIDVIHDVIKPYKSTSYINDDHNQYTDILSLYSDATINNTKVYMINNIAPPQTVNINKDDLVIASAIRINKSAVKLSSDIPINVGSVNKIKVESKRSNMKTLSTFVEAPILNINIIIDNDESIKLQKYVLFNFYTVNPNILDETYFYFKSVSNINKLYKHSPWSPIDTIATSSDLNNSLTSGLYYFNNGDQPDGYLINLIYYSSLNEFYLDNTPCIQITDKIQVYTNDNGLGNNYILKAKNTVLDVTDTTFAKAELIKSNTRLLIGITKNIKLYEINTSGIAICPTSTDNVYKIQVDRILRLCYASLNSILTTYTDSIYIYDSNSLNSSYQTLLHNTPNGIEEIPNGYYMIGANATLNDNVIQINGANISMYQRLLPFVNGKINYTDFGITCLSTNTDKEYQNYLKLSNGTIFFADEKTTSPISQTFTIPTNFNSFTTLVDRAIQLDSVVNVSNTYYIGTNCILYNLFDDSIDTSLNGVFIINNIYDDIDKYYEINNQTGAINLYNGLVYTKTGIYNNILNGIATPLSSGVYIDNNNKVISVGINGIWNFSDSDLANKYIKINTLNDSFIIRKLVYQSSKDIYLLHTPDDHTKTRSLVNIEGKLYKIVTFNHPVVLVTNKYVKDSDNIKLYLSDKITGELISVDDGLYSWVIHDKNIIYQINNGYIYWIKDESNFNYFDTITIKYPLFIEKLLNGNFGKLYEYNSIFGSLLPLKIGQYFLMNIKENNVISSLLSFDSPYIPVNNRDTFNIYYKITNEYNAPVSDKIIVNSSRTFILNENGCSNSEISSTSLYIIKPDSTLEYWDGENHITSGPYVQNKVYIGYDDKLSRTCMDNNKRCYIITEKYWVKHIDTTYNLYIDSIPYTPIEGTIISVNSNNKNKRYMAENGLKIYSIDKYGNKKWFSLVTRDSLSDSVNIIPYYFKPPQVSYKCFTQVHNLNVQNTITVNIILTNSDEHIIAPVDPIVDSGIYYYNITENKLYKENNGLWTTIFNPEYFIRADGKLYISTDNNDNVYTESKFIKTPLNLYRMSNFETTGLGTEISQIGSTTWCYDLSNNKLYYGNIEIKITINITVILTELDECVVPPTNPIFDSGIYYYNTTDNKLYREFNGLWTSIFPSIYFIRADGKIYVSESNSNAKTYVGVLNSLVKLENNGIVCIITSVGIDGLASSGLGATIVEKYKSSLFLISDKLYTITTNTPIGINTQPNNWIQLSTGVIKVCPNNVVLANSQIAWSTNSITYDLQNNTGLFRFSNFYVLLKQSDNTIYTIKQSKNLSSEQYYNEVLVIDGMVQDEFAPRGTVIYTDSGVFIRSGYSTTQINSGINDIARDSWYNGLIQ